MNKFVQSFFYITVLVGFFSNLALADPLQDQITALLNRYNHIVIDPPNSTILPGSFVHRENYDPKDDFINSTQLGYLCTPEFSTDKINANPIVKNIQSNLFLRSGRIVRLSKDSIRDDFGMPVTARYANSVIIRFKEKSILEYSIEDLEGISTNLGPICKQLVQDNIETDNAYQIKSIFRMSLRYEVKLKPNVSASIKERIINEIEDTIGTHEFSLNTAAVSGQVEVYGINWRKIYHSNL